MMRVLMVLVSAALTLSWLGCNDDAGDNLSRGCVDDPSICPEGTRCQLDAVGQGYCELLNGAGADSGMVATYDMAPQGDGSVNDAELVGSGESEGDEGLPTSGQPNSGDGGSLPQGGTESTSEMPAGSAGGGAGECPQINLLLKPEAGSVARVMLVVDRSASMINEQDRWTPLTEALQTVMTNLGNGVQFGLTLFPNPWSGPEEDERCAAGMVNVPVDFGNQAEILMTMDVGRPVSNRGTPTASALGAAGRFFIDNPSENDYILLATDGGPGCNAFANEPSRHDDCVCLSSFCWENINCLDADRTVRVVQMLNQQGIETMVLGITMSLPAETTGCDEHSDCDSGQACSCVSSGCGPGNVGTCEDQLRPTLSRLAVAGGRDNDGSYFEVTNLAELAASVQRLAGSIRPCSFGLEDLGAFGNDLQLMIDDMVIPNDPSRQNGWYAEDNVLTLYGSACTAIRDGQAHTISAQCLQ